MAVVENTVYLKSEGHLQELNGTLPKAKQDLSTVSRRYHQILSTFK
jgi:hypothetical protein